MAEYETIRLEDYRPSEPGARGSFDVPFAMLTLLLLSIGVVMVLSASFARAYYDFENRTGGRATYYFLRQLVFAVLGVVAMFAASRFHVNTYRKYSVALMGIALGLLFAVLFIGSKINNARRWINLGFTTFQPSEIAKIAMILYFATLICKYKERMATPRGLIPFVAILASIIFLLVLEPHFSASVIMFLIAAIMLFLGGAQLRWFIVGGGAFALVGLLIVTKFSYASSRISAWLNPYDYATGDGWQIIQSLYAVGSGGLLGTGLGQSRQKYLYLPEEHNDFIFSVVCEELGFIGAVLILLLFALLVCRGYWLAIHAKDRYSFLVCMGITSLLAIQVILNVAVVTNFMPATGISLPFFSYGGTALLIQLAEMGIILSISRDIPSKKSG